MKAAQDSPDVAEGLRRFYRNEQARRLDLICYGFLAFVGVSILLAGLGLAAVFLGWLK